MEAMDEQDEKPEPIPIWMRNTGRKMTSYGAESLRNACIEYFRDIVNNPLEEDKAFVTKHGIQHATVRKMRAMSIVWASAIMYAQKFEGAAADLLNANLISRDLGLVDQHKVGGIEGAPIETKGPSDLARMVAFLLQRDAQKQRSGQK